MTRFAGVVLCGGQSSRMGRPKAWLPVGNEVLLQRVVRILQSAASPVVVVAAPGQELPPLPESTLITHDEIAGRGPLSGLAAGLKALTGQADAVYLSGCDAPFLTAEFAWKMQAFLTAEYDAVLPEVDGYLQPLAAVYRTTVLREVELLLAQDRRRTTDLVAMVRTRILRESELPDRKPLRNVNTPEDYAAVLQEIASTEASGGSPSTIST